MRCGRFGLPHCGQRFTRGASSRCVARRLSRRDLDVFLFGTAMSRRTVAKMLGMAGTLSATEITKSHGGETILDRVSMVVPPRARIGVVGPNGVGKSTLLRVLAGLEEPDRGRVTRRPPDLTVRYLAQQRERQGLSGGEAARAALREIFDSDDDVLLLDEPTNDLDFTGLALLERFVARTPAAIVVVSHDRAFLERAVERVVEFEAGTRRVQEYAGSWAEYERSRDAARREHEAAYERYVAEREKLQALQRARQGQARRAGSRKLARETGGSDRRATHALSSKVRNAERRLERLVAVEKPWEPWRLQLELGTRRGGDVVARLDDAVVERGAFAVGPVSLELRHGDRLALVGPNGSGKTTLLQALLGELPLARGSRHVGPSTRFGVLEQDRALFDRDKPLLEPFLERTGLGQAQARTLLARFALGADEVTRPARSLSPGERTRATLALLAAQGANTLVLDEPTNHLDLEAIEELERALDGYEGTVVLVTHDRRLLEAFEPTRTLELPA
jgi:ATPase subunit of ABC transporter with duplicated ATPase domains